MTFPCLNACVFLQFAFLRLAPPHHTDGTREAIDDGFPPSAFFGCLLCRGAFFVSPPPATPAVHDRVLIGGLTFL